jgi:hypothetical protein
MVTAASGRHGTNTSTRVDSNVPRELGSNVRAGQWPRSWQTRFSSAVFGALLMTLPSPAIAQMADDEEIAHPFFTHEGLPDSVGVYSTRLSGLATRADEKSTGDFGFHLETGITDKLGLHIRSDQFLMNRRSEAMLQYAVLKSADGESGLAPIVELEFPTRAGGGKARALVGFTSKLARRGFAVNQVMHYNLSEKSFETSVSLVVRASNRIYPVVELLGEGGVGKPTVLNALAGLKFRVQGSTLIGLAYKRPITSAREISSQFVLQLEFMVGKRAK